MKCEYCTDSWGTEGKYALEDKFLFAYQDIYHFIHVQQTLTTAVTYDELLVHFMKNQN